MLVSEIIDMTAGLLGIGGSDVGALSPITEGDRARLLSCVNLVVDEVARDYFPLKARQKFDSPDGKIYYADFEREPIAVYGVYKGGASLKFRRLYDCLTAESGGETEVEYAYKPENLTEDGQTPWQGGEVSERIIAYGAAAEYCIICGLEGDAQMWDKRYRDALERAVFASSSGRKIPKRRWSV